MLGDDVAVSRYVSVGHGITLSQVSVGDDVFVGQASLGDDVAVGQVSVGVMSPYVVSVSDVGG